MKAILIHGTDGDSNSNWLPWLKSQLETRNLEVYCPSLPDSDFPNGEKWTDYILENIPFTIDEDTVIVGHSAGASLIPQLLQKLPKDTKIRKAILVSGFHNTLGWDKLRDLQNVAVDYNQVRQKAQDFVIIHSDNDPYVPIAEAEWLANQLNSRVTLIKGQGHFNLGFSPKYREFPKLLAIILKENALQNLYLASSFRYPGVADLIMTDIEKQLGKAPTDIKVAYITTAGNLHPEDQRDWINDGRKILQARGWQVQDLDIADKTRQEAEAEIGAPDVVFVQGGQCIYMLEQMQNCQFGQIVRALLARGAFYIGESTGSIIAGRNIEPYRYLARDRRTNPPVLDNYQGMGLVNFLIRPHWNSPSKRERYLSIFTENLEKIYNIDQPMIFLNDNQLVRVEGGNFQIWEA